MTLTRCLFTRVASFTDLYIYIFLLKNNVNDVSYIRLSLWKMWFAWRVLECCRLNNQFICVIGWWTYDTVLCVQVLATWCVLQDFRRGGCSREPHLQWLQLSKCRCDFQIFWFRVYEDTCTYCLFYKINLFELKCRM